EQNHQEHDDELGRHERHDPLGHPVHRHSPDPSHHVQHYPHRRSDKADRVVHDEHHPEVNRVDATRLHHRHEHRGEDQDRRRHVHRRADDHYQHHDHHHQHD